MLGTLALRPETIAKVSQCMALYQQILSYVQYPCECISRLGHDREEHDWTFLLVRVVFYFVDGVSTDSSDACLDYKAAFKSVARLRAAAQALKEHTSCKSAAISSGDTANLRSCTKLATCSSVPPCL